MIKWIIQWYQKFTFHNVCSFQKVLICKLDPIKLGSSCETQNRNGVNKQNTHTKHSEKDNTRQG